jgi:hypothetical protein
LLVEKNKDCVACEFYLGPPVGTLEEKDNLFEPSAFLSTVFILDNSPFFLSADTSCPGCAEELMIVSSRIYWTLYRKGNGNNVE